MSFLTVETVHGPVKGFVDRTPISKQVDARTAYEGPRAATRKWLGIPYARAKRWRRPEAPESWTEPLECLDYKVPLGCY